MRNLFTINVKTKEHGFDEFLIRKSDSTLKAQYDENAKLMDGAVKKRFAPIMYLSLTALACGAIGIAIFMSQLKDVDFAQAYSAVGWALYVGIAGIALFVILVLAAFIWMRKFMVNPQTQNFFEEQHELETKITHGLRIPENCAEIDIMYRPYKLKKGNKKFQTKSYVNLPMWVFVEGEKLCFADTFGVWAVPLYSITSITPFPGHATLSTWNKEEKLSSLKYKRIVRFDNGNYIVKGYSSLQFLCHGEEWEILIPAYDIDYICELTGKDSTIT